MRLTRHGSLLLMLLLALVAAPHRSARPRGPPATQPKARTVAIFIKNRARDVPDEKVMPLEDLVAGKISDAGYRVISREDVANSVKAYATAGPNVGTDVKLSADLDKLLSDNTSALRLAQNMGARLPA